MARDGGYPLVATGGSTRRQSVRDQMSEMLALRELERERGLTHQESERLGMLVYREQQRARYRPDRIRRLRAELELLVALEIAEKGVAALPPEPSDMDFVRDDDGAWSAPEAMAA